MNETPTARLEALQAAAQREPHRGDVRYLLGAELASAGRYESAIEELTHAVGLDQSLHTAKLQLGLLHLTCAHRAEALAAWRPLDELPRSEPLRMFARGLKALANDDFRSCIALLERGMHLNTANPALNHDMALIIDRARSASGNERSAEGPEGVRTDFSLYEPDEQ